MADRTPQRSQGLVPVIGHHSSQQNGGNLHIALSAFAHGAEQPNTTRVLHYAPVDNRQYHVHSQCDNCGALRRQLQAETETKDQLIRKLKMDLATAEQAHKIDLAAKDKGNAASIKTLQSSLDAANKLSREHSQRWNE
jgi:hypothetical protein